MAFLGLEASLAVFLIAGIILVVINAFYKFMINQEEAGRIKDRMGELSKESRKLAKENPEKSKQLMDEMMKEQRHLMRKNMKPMIVSLIVVAIALPWLGAAYHDRDVAIANGVSVSPLSLDDINYDVTLQENNVMIKEQTTNKIKECTAPCKLKFPSGTWRVEKIAEDKVRLSIIAAVLPPPISLPLVGSELGWIVWYILASIPLAILIRTLYGIRS